MVTEDVLATSRMTDEGGNQAWLEAVEEHRDTIEAIAASDLPLAEDCQALLEEADEAGSGSTDT